MFHAGPAKSIRNAGGLCCDPSETRVPYVPRRAREIHQKCRCIMLRPFRNASSICSTRAPRNPAEIQVDFVATLQKRECHMFHAGPAKSIRNTGGFCCDPKIMRVPYVPRRAREIHQKCGWIMLRPFRNASAICSTQGPRNPAEIRVLYVAPRSSGPKFL